MTKNITGEQKKELAKLLYTKENLTQAEIAERVGTSRVTIGKWIKNENWEMLKVSITMTKEEQLKALYRQIAEINEAISERDKGLRYATVKEADTIVKLSSAIRTLETEVGMSDIVEVLSSFTSWIRASDLEKAKEIVLLGDAFIKYKLD